MKQLSYYLTLRCMLGLWLVLGLTIPDRMSAQVQQVPYSQDFEAFNTCGISCGDICNLSEGWVNPSTGDTQDWTVDTGGTLSSNTGPSEDHTLGTSAGKYVYMETSTPCFGGDDTAYMVSPPIDLGTLPGVGMKYWYHMFGEDMGSLHVDISNDGGTTWQLDLVPPIAGDQGDQWLEGRANLIPFAGDTILIRFRGISGPDFESDMALDDISFFALPANDVGVSGFVGLESPVSPGLTSIDITLENFGTNTLTSATIDWEVDGVAQAPFNWTGSLAPGASVGPVTIGNTTFTRGSASVSASSSLPNGLADADPSNDSARASFSVCNPLSGTITVGGATADFATLNEAIDALSVCGIVGPVVFSLNPGVYNESVKLVALEGITSNNTITIDGQNPAQVRVVSDGGDNENAVFHIEGGDYYILTNMTIENNKSGTTDAWGVRLSDTAEFNIISNNIIEMNPGGTSDVVGIVATNSATFLSSGINANYTLVQNNIITGGAQGINFLGTTSNRNTFNQIIGNTIDGAEDRGIDVDDQDSIVIADNIVRNLRDNFADGIYCEDIQDYTISGNTVLAPDYGIYVADGNFDAVPTKTGEIINNMVRSDADRALSLDDVEETNVYHNSLWGEPAAYVNDLNRVSFENNIFKSDGDFVFEALDTTATDQITINYNIYDASTGNSNFVDAGPINYASLADWVAAEPQFNANSLEGDPVFNSGTDLHLTGILANGAGNNNLGVREDIDKDPRPLPPSVNVDIGADEYSPPVNDAGVTALVSPAGSFLPGVLDVSVEVSNQGILNPIDNVVIEWTANGVPQTPLNYNTQIPIGGSADVSLGNFTFPNGPVTFVFYTTSPNGSFDPRPENDTLRVTLCPGLSGVYTLGAPTDDFPDFESAIDTLVRCGAAGAVTFNISPGTYNTSIELVEIPGASASNTITFDGLDKNSVFIISDGDTTGNAVISLNGADWVTFANMTIENNKTTSDAWGVRLFNEANHNTIRGNLIKTSTSGTSDYVGILASSSPTSVFGSGNNANYTLIENNMILGGDEGIYIYGNSTARNFFNQIIGNVVDSAYDKGIDVDDQDSVIIANNTVRNLRSTFGDGIYCEDIQDYQITGNNVIAPDWGIYVGDGNALAPHKVRGQIINNMAIGESDDAIYLTDVEDTDIYHNTSLGKGGGSGIYMTSADTLDVRNNLFASLENYAIEITSSSNTATFDSLDYNLYYTPDSNNNFTLIGSVSYQDLAAWQADSTLDNVHSQESNPEFLGEDDLHVEGIFAYDRGDSTLGVTVDIDGDTRPLAPSLGFDIGADEFALPLNNAGAVAVVSPVAPFSSGPTDVSVEIVNAGGNVLNSVDIVWEVNGIVQGTIPYTTPINPGATAGPIVLGNLNLPNGFTNLRFYTTMPNGMMDSRPENDTLALILCPVLRGVLTLGTPTSDFETFEEAIEACVVCTVDSHTVFQVQPGTYQEAVTIPVIASASDSTTITFDGLDADSVMVMSDGADAENAVFHLAGADWITLTNMTIENNKASTSDAWGIRLSNSADHNTISDNVVLVPRNGTSDVVGIVATNSGTFLSAGNNANYTLIENNLVIGGDEGINILGITATRSMYNRIIGNVVDSANDKGIDVDDQDSVIIANNVVRNLRASSGDGIYGEDIQDFQITGNNVIGRDWGIYVNDGNSLTDPNVRGRIVNNMTIGGGDDGLYLFDVHGTDVFHNTSVATGTGAGIWGTSLDSVDIRNNVFVSQNGLAVDFSTSVNLDSIDYNLYYSLATNGDFVEVGNDDYLDLVSWQTAVPADNVHSVEGDPVFIAPDDLHLDGLLANDIGDNSLGIMVDIDGDSRPLPPSTTVDMGADEYTPPSNNAGIIALVSPTNPITPGVQPILVDLENRGANTIDSVDITWTVNGVSQGTLRYMTPILPEDTAFAVNLGNFNFTTGLFRLEIVTSNPNGEMDSRPANDTLRILLCTELGGVYSIGSDTADFFSIGDALSACEACMIADTVTFQLAPGTYQESNTIPVLPGVSAMSPLTFDGLNADSVLVIGDGEGAENAVFHLDGIDWVTLTNMTIENNKIGTDAWGIRLSSAADHNTISNNVIRTSISGTSDVVGIIATSSGTTSSSFSGDGNNANYTLIKDNLVIGGDEGINLIGDNPSRNTFNQIIGNVIDSTNDKGIDVDDQDSIVIANNVVRNLRSTGGDGIYCEDIQDFQITGNNAIGNDWGIYINDGNSLTTPNTRGRIINNMTIGRSDDALYLSDVHGTDVFHNTAFAQGEGAGLFATELDSVDIRNNIFVGEEELAVDFSTTTNLDTLDYNVYFSFATNGDFAEFGAAAYPDLAAWQAGSPTDNVHSVQGEPIFIGTDDLHIVSPVANNAGDSTLGVLVDIDGEVRPKTPGAYDIGADEYDPRAKDAVLIDLIISAATCGDSNTVVTVLARNLGVDSIKSLPITVEMSGDGMATFSQTAMTDLAFADTLTLDFAPFNTYEGGDYTFTAYTLLPGDESSSNDTLSKTINLFSSAAPLYAGNTPACPTDSITLSVVPEAFVEFGWFESDTSMTPLAEGDTYRIPAITQPDTFFIGGLTGVFSAGKPDRSGSGGNFTSVGVQFLEVTVSTSIRVDSMTVYPNSAGDVVVNFVPVDGSPAISSSPIAVNPSSTNGPVRIFVGINVPPGEYRVGAEGTTTGGLFRNDGDAVYPYEVPGIVSITGNTFDPDYYYFFYDWQVSLASCPRPRTEVIVSPEPLAMAGFTADNTVGDLLVSVTPSSSNADSTIFLWGDGSSSSDTVHMYADTGSYVISAVAFGTCGTDTFSQAVDVTCTFATGSFVFDIDNTSGVLVSFTGEATGADSVLYDFGGLGTSTDLNPTFNFQSSGNYPVTLTVFNLCGSTTFTDTVFLILTNIDGLLSPGSLELYPNPADKLVNLSFDVIKPADLKIDWIDGRGRTVMNQRHEQFAGTYQEEFKVDNLAEGVYLIRIQLDEEVIIRKVQVK